MVPLLREETVIAQKVVVPVVLQTGGTLFTESLSTKRANKEKKEAFYEVQKKTPQPEKATVTGGQRGIRDESAKLLHQNKLRDNSRPIRREKKKDSCDLNGRYHLRQL